MLAMMDQQLALIGYGEAGSTFARAGGWQEKMVGYDLLAGRRELLAKDGMISVSSVGEALAHASLILSLVTAEQALDAARDHAPFLMRDALYCDMNSVSPDTKQAAAATIEAAGGRYVDVAVLAPVNPARMDVPLMLAGKAAEDAKVALREIGFANIRVVGAAVGKASAIKMIRSIMVKGLEALTDEMIAAAQAAEVTDEVLASLDASEKAIPWRTRAAYNLERMATHGARRAAEMEEAARTLIALGVAPVMTRATVLRQREAGLKNGKGGSQ